MFYKNTSGVPKILMINRVGQVIAPQGFIYLDDNQVSQAGVNMRFFEPAKQEPEVVIEEKKETKKVEEKIVKKEVEKVIKKVVKKVVKKAVKNTSKKVVKKSSKK